MSLQWTRGTIVSRREWYDGLFTLRVEALDVLPFEPGQFLQLGLPLGDKHVHRPYSVASPHGSCLEFFIVLVPDGELTPHLYRLSVGDQIDVSDKPAGRFTLSHGPLGSTLWLIATGTGLAPYIAMLRAGQVWKQYERVVLVHGVRYGNDLAYREELEGFQDRNPSRFAYIPTTSRDDHFHALTGRISTLLDSGELEDRAGERFEAERSGVMLCGNPAMLDEMEQLLIARGLTRHRSKSPGQIVVERYW